MNMLHIRKMFFCFYFIRGFYSDLNDNKIHGMMHHLHPWLELKNARTSSMQILSG